MGTNVLVLEQLYLILARSKRTSRTPSVSRALNRNAGVFVFWNRRNNDRHQNGVEYLGGQRPSRRTEELLEQGPYGVVPRQGGHEAESRRYQLRELVQNLAHQRYLLFAAFTTRTILAPPRPVIANPSKVRGFVFGSPRRDTGS